MSFQNVEVKVKGFLRTALSAEASTTTIDIDWIDEDNPSTVITPQSDSLMFEIDPLNTTGKGSEICLGTSLATDTPSSGRTRYSTVTRGLLKYGAATTGSAARAKSWDVGTPVAIATGTMAKQVNKLVSQHTTNTSNTTYSGNNTHSGAEVFTGSFKHPVYADATARDAAIPSPANGMVVYLTDEGVNYQYIGGAWTTYATGSVSNASTTVAGKVEIATAEERAAGTSTGGTGALLVPSNDALVKTSSGASDENKIPVLDSEGQLATGFMPTNVQEANTFFGATDVTAEAVNSLKNPTWQYGENLTAGDPVSTINTNITYAGPNTVTADTDTNEASPATNYVSSTTLEPNGYNIGASDRISLLAFGNLSAALPNVVRIISFDLNIKVVTGNAGTNWLAFPITSAWTPATVTWNTNPTIGSQMGSVASSNGVSTKTISCTVTSAAITTQILTYGVMVTIQNAGVTNTFQSLENAGATPATITNVVYITRDGKIYRTDANFVESTQEFLGFVETTDVADSSHTLRHDGVLTTTSLTPGSDYYLSDTIGTIATSAGTNSKKVGRAVSATRLIIKNDN